MASPAKPPAPRAAAAADAPADADVDPGAHERLSWAAETLEGMRPVCEMLEAGENAGYAAALDEAQQAVKDPQRTYSARLLAEISDSGLPFAHFGLQLANSYKEYFLELQDDFNQHNNLLRQESDESLQRQRDIEASDELSLDDYLARYYA